MKNQPENEVRRCHCDACLISREEDEAAESVRRAAQAKAETEVAESIRAQTFRLDEALSGGADKSSEK